jgi:hypothetical protein
MLPSDIYQCSYRLLGPDNNQDRLTFRLDYEITESSFITGIELFVDGGSAPLSRLFYLFIKRTGRTRTHTGHILRLFLMS